jgi:hypothetical protein
MIYRPSILSCRLCVRRPYVHVNMADTELVATRPPSRPAKMVQCVRVDYPATAAVAVGNKSN